MQKYFFRFVTAEEVLAQIEEDDSVTSAKVFIQPPKDGMDSEGDSGDEETGGTVNNLSGKQLQAAAEAKLSSSLHLHNKAIQMTTKSILW